MDLSVRRSREEGILDEDVRLSADEAESGASSTAAHFAKPTRLARFLTLSLVLSLDDAGDCMGVSRVDLL